MAKTRYTGRSGKIYIDADGGDPASYSEVTVCRNVQLPTESRARIDVTGMADARAETRPGIEEESEFSFEIQYDYNDSVDASLRTSYSNQSNAHFKFEATDGTTTYTVTWSGYIVALEPLAVDGSSPVAMRVVGVRSSAITESVA